MKVNVWQVKFIELFLQFSNNVKVQKYLSDIKWVLKTENSKYLK